MKHCSYIVESYTHSGSLSFTDFRSTSNQQTFNIYPRNIGGNRMRKNSLQRFVMFCSQLWFHLFFPLLFLNVIKLRL